jgi:hypothetical protein
MESFTSDEENVMDTPVLQMKHHQRNGKDTATRAEHQLEDEEVKEKF